MVRPQLPKWLNYEGELQGVSRGTMISPLTGHQLNAPVSLNSAQLLALPQYSYTASEPSLGVEGTTSDIGSNVAPRMTDTLSFTTLLAAARIALVELVLKAFEYSGFETMYVDLEATSSIA